MASARFAIGVLSTMLVVVILSTQTASALRRRRCHPRLCRKCEVFVNSRWRRSLPDLIPNRKESALNAPGISPNALLQLVQNVSTSTLLDGSVSRYSERRVFNFIRKMQQREMDDTEMLDGTSERDLPDRAFAGRMRSRVQRRSVSAHVRRCLHIMRTPCCRKYGNSVFYIGYRLKY